MPSVPSEDEVLGYLETLSNWGRWGPDDELGTLNYITPAKRLEALRTVREGITVGCARPILLEGPSADVNYAPQHYMLRSGEAASGDPAMDFIGMVFHGWSITHVDALGHFFWQRKMYNGRPSDAVSTEHGATFGSVAVMKDGIVTRGVLLDLTRLKGKLWLEAGEPIFPEDLEAAEEAQGVRVSEGDALLLRTGWYARRRAVGPHPNPRERPGLHAATLPWLHERKVALIAADAAQDVGPSGYQQIGQPIHVVGLVAMGLCLMDNCQFDDLAAACAERGRWECLYVVAPLRFRSATGSPTTPIALL